MVVESGYELTGKVALICGAGGQGVGAATSERLARLGADVVAVDYSAELVEETVEKVSALGRKCYGIVADLTVPEQRGKVVAQGIERAGRIDLVANIAGGTRPHQWGRFEGVPDHIYTEIMALNLDYVFTVCRDVTAHMIERGIRGAIVNVASVSALPSAPFHAAYGAAKAGVITLTRSIAAELGHYGIRANVVAPGATKTGRADQLLGEKMEARYRNWNPLAKTTAPEEVADAIAYLLSDAARGITGVLIPVDAGMTARCALGGVDYFEGRSNW
jgi:NAD(P)-dependent dehydrogenase (short-subunit alcohol dehydrogenase family)